MEITTVNVAFGRFNPPHIGHEELFKFGRSLGRDFRIYPTNTQNKKTDPLTFYEKCDLLRVGGFGETFKAPKQTLFGIIEDIESQKIFDKINFILGGDRNEEFRSLLQKYQSDYEIELTTTNFADRDRYIISSTEMRNFCKIGDYVGFMDHSLTRLSPNQKLEVYRKVSVAIQGHVKLPHDKTRSAIFSKAISD